MRSTLQRIFQAHWPSYRAAHRLPLRAHKAAEALVTCRTAALGGHAERCPRGHVQRVWYNACRHRACPLCAWRERARWVNAQTARLPACDYFHVIFTIPGEYNALWRYNRAAFTNLLSRCAWATLREMLADPRHLGALPGALAGFHSWGQTLWLHPHVHMLVTAGGLDPNGQWRPCPHGGLLPARALSAKFRGKLRAWLMREIEAQRLVLPAERRRRQWLNELNRLGRVKHHVMVMPRYAHGRGVVAYLGRYLKGGCVSDRRLHLLEDGRVRLSYRENRTNPPKRATVTLEPADFLGRVLEHVPQTGQRVVRSYGLFACGKRAELRAVRAALGGLPEEDEAPPPTLAGDEDLPLPPCCPVCGAALIRVPIPRTARSPPERRCA